MTSENLNIALLLKYRIHAATTSQPSTRSGPQLASRVALWELAIRAVTASISRAIRREINTIKVLAYQPCGNCKAARHPRCVTSIADCSTTRSSGLDAAVRT